MTLVVDASALVAIAQSEPGYERLIDRLVDELQVWASPVNLLETGMALTRLWPQATEQHFHRLLRRLNIVESTVPLFPSAFDAFLRFGKGRHPARLNLGDCFAYALARTLDAPLLFVGNDFPLTDVRPAL